jgi:hypothetical protein
MLPSLQTPTTTPDLSDASKVCISVARDRFTRDHRISPGRDDRSDTSLSSRNIDLTPVVPTIRNEALHRIRHLFEEPWKRSRIRDRSIGEFDGQNVPTLVSGDMQLSPASPTPVRPTSQTPIVPGL